MSEFVKTASIQLTAADIAAIENICRRWHVKTKSAAIRIALAVAQATPKAHGRYRKRAKYRKRKVSPAPSAA